MEHRCKALGWWRLLAAVMILGLWGAASEATKVKTKTASLDTLSFSQPGLRVAPQVEPDQGMVRSIASPATIEAFDRLLTVERTEWQMDYDRATGLPNYMGGKGIPWIPGSGQDNTVTGVDLGLPAEFAGKDVPLNLVEAKARAFMESYKELFGASGSDLFLNREGSGPVADYLYYVSFDCTYYGLPVESARVSFTLNHGNLIEVGQEFIGPELKALDPKPSFSEDTAWQIAWGFLGQVEPGVGDRVVGPAKLSVIPVSSEAFLSGIPVEPGKGIKYRLVYSMVFHRDGEVGNWETRIDAHTGEVISFRDINAYGNIRGGTYKSDKPFSEQVTPFPYADYGATSWSDVGGNFAGTSGTSTMTGRTGSAGNVGSVDIVDGCGSISLVSDGSGIINFGTSLGLDCTTPGVGGAGNTHAARTQYWNVAQIKIKAYTYLPTNTWLQGRLTDNVNGTTTTCNAYWNGTSVNFFRSGGGCWNTGELPGVSLHEWGHGMDANDGTAASNGGTGETYGDITATLQTHSSCMGNGFLGPNCSGYGDNCTSCSGVREIDYDKHSSKSPYVPTQLDDTAGYHCPTDSSCYGPCGYECHCESLISSQAIWDLAARDLITWGMDQATAWQLVDRLWYVSRPTATSAYYCPTISTTSGCATGTLWRVFRAADDDDGNLNNGTPHMTALSAAFNRHVIACTTDAGYNTNSTTCPTIGSTVVTATPATGTVYLNWYAATNASTYSVYRNESGCDQGYTKIATVTAPTVTYTDTQVVNGITYNYRIQAVGTDTDCVGPMSPCSSATPLTCTPPSAPSSVTAAANGNYRIDVSWASVAGITCYNLYRSGTSGGPWTLLATTSSSTTSYSDTSVYGTYTYYYMVRTFATCESINSTQASATALGTCNMAPTFAGITSATNALASTCGNIITWAAGSSSCGGTVTYTVYRSSEYGFTPAAGFAIATGLTGTTYTDNGVSFGTNYYYCVRAFDSVSGLSDSNSLKLMASPTGTPATIYSQTFESTSDWTTAAGTPAATTGTFIRGTPVATIGNYGEPSQPGAAHGGTQCWYTAANPTGAAGTDDVDGGETITISPLNINLSAYPTARFQMYRWFLNELTDDSGDYYILEVSNNNGSTWTTLDSLPDSISYLGGATNNQWNFVDLKIDDVISLTNQMRFRIRVADGTSKGGLIECAIDDIAVKGYPTCTGCTAPAVPTGLTATPNGANRIDLSWSGSAAKYRIYRVMGSCGSGYTQVAGNVTGTTWSDTSVSAGSTYAYVVKGLSSSNCESSASACASATATGVCNLAPTFAGVATVANSHSSTCGIGLTWAAATLNCGTSIVYNIYRGTSSSFVPGDSTRIVKGYTGLSYSDTAGLVYGTTYYYIVRAEDNTAGGSGPNGGNEETNTVTKGAGPSGGLLTGGTLFSDNFDSGSGTTGWSTGYFAGDDVEWRGRMACTARSGSNIFRWGGSTCTGNYTASKASLASPQPGAYGLDIPFDATNVRLSFWHRYNFSTNDGAIMLIQKQPTATYSFIPSAAMTGHTYNGTTGTNNVLGSGYACWAGNYSSTFYNTIIDLDAACVAVDGLPCAGSTIQIAFTGTSDTDTSRQVGWFLDDVLVTADYGATSCTTAGCSMAVEVTPASKTTGTGQDIVFTASHTQTGGPYTYQWTENGANISGAILSTLAISKASGGTYTYNCKVTDASGLCVNVQDSASATGTWVSSCTLTVDVTPNGTTTACTGSSITFTATPTGGIAPYTYQWTEGGTNISGATNSTYGANKASAGTFSYNCKVSCSGCTDITDATASTGTWVAPPAVDVTPASSTVCTGTAIVFTAAASGGTSPYTYQWTEGGTNISGATNSTYSASKASAGTFSYNCKVYSTGCATAGTDATASTGTWVAPPAVDVTPASSTVCTGTAIVFTAAASGGTSPYTYQWTEGGTDISGATNSTYNASKASAGTFSYNCKVYSTGCATAGTDATASTGTWVAPPTSVSVIPTGTTTACTGAGITFTATVVGGATPVYQWTENGSNISGATNSTYIPTKAAASTYAYSCIVNNTGCSTTVTDSTPSIGTWIAPPTGVTVTPSGTTTACTGAGITFTATVSGGATPIYQWTEGGTNISGATSSTYTATKASAGSFNYTCVVYNTGCTTTVTDATPSTGTWVAPPTAVSVTPASSAVCTGVSVTFTATVTGGATPVYQWTENGTNISGATNSTCSVSKASAGSFNYTCVVYNTGCTTTATDATPSTGTWVALPTVDVTPNGTTQVTIGNPITFTATATGGTAPYTYQWTIDGADLAGATNSAMTETYGTIQTHTYNCKVASTGCTTTAQDATASTGDWISAGCTTPGEVANQQWTDSATHTWDALVPAVSYYLLYRGQLANLADLPTGAVVNSCNRFTTASTSVTLAEDPTTLTAGDFYWYLVIGHNDPNCNGTPGTNRVINSSGPCP